MQYTIIAAVAKNRVIGNKGKIPWRIPEDMRRFRQLTIPHPIIMGRSTYESLPSKPLKERTNIVVSSSLQCSAQGVYVCKTLEEALALAQHLDEQAFIIGGEQVYQQTINHPRITLMELTEVHQEYEGDAFFPEFKEEWVEISRTPREFYTFVSYRKIQKI